MFYFSFFSGIVYNSLESLHGPLPTHTNNSPLKSKFISNKQDLELNDRNERYIGRASAGGYAAFHNASRHQDMFSKVWETTCLR